MNNILACVNTKLLADYCAIDPRLPRLVALVKHWAKQRAVNDPYRGTLSSYCYVLMCIHLLQTRPTPVLPALQQLPPTFRRAVGQWTCEFCDDVSTGLGGREDRTEGGLLAVGWLLVLPSQLPLRVATTLSPLPPRQPNPPTTHPPPPPPAGVLPARLWGGQPREPGCPGVGLLRVLGLAAQLLTRRHLGAPRLLPAQGRQGLDAAHRKRATPGAALAAAPPVLAVCLLCACACCACCEQ